MRPSIGKPERNDQGGSAALVTERRLRARVVLVGTPHGRPWWYRTRPFAARKKLLTTMSTHCQRNNGTPGGLAVGEPHAVAKASAWPLREQGAREIAWSASLHWSAHRAPPRPRNCGEVAAPVA